MAEKKYTLDDAAHGYYGVACNNAIWPHLENTNRTQGETEEMLSLAHAARYHWRNSPRCKPVNRVRAEYMLARVYTFAERREEATHYAENCLSLANKYSAEIADFDLAYAYEALTRTAALLKNKNAFDDYLELTNIAASKIKDPEDKKVFDTDFKTAPWFGMNS